MPGWCEVVDSSAGHGNRSVDCDGSVDELGPTGDRQGGWWRTGRVEIVDLSGFKHVLPVSVEENLVVVDVQAVGSPPTVDSDWHRGIRASPRRRQRIRDLRDSLRRPGVVRA